MKKLLVLLFSILILPFSVYASDVYYCSDDGLTGFNPKQNFDQKNYAPQNFKVMIDFKNEYIISEDIYFSKNYENKCIFEDIASNALYCISAIGSAFSINKINLRFIRSVMFNSKNYQDDIGIGYGSCQKF